MTSSGSSVEKIVFVRRPSGAEIVARIRNWPGSYLSRCDFANGTENVIGLLGSVSVNSWVPTAEYQVTRPSGLYRLIFTDTFALGGSFSPAGRMMVPVT